MSPVLIGAFGDGGVPPPTLPSFEIEHDIGGDACRPGKLYRRRQRCFLAGLPCLSSTALVAKRFCKFPFRRRSGCSVNTHQLRFVSVWSLDSARRSRPSLEV